MRPPHEQDAAVAEAYLEVARQLESQAQAISWDIRGLEAERRNALDEAGRYTTASRAGACPVCGGMPDPDTIRDGRITCTASCATWEI